MLSSLLLLTVATSPKAEIQQAYNVWADAYMRHDVDRLDRLISSDFVMILGNGARRDRIDFLGSIMRGFGMGQVITHFTVRIDKLVQTHDGWNATITEQAQVGNGKFGQITEDGWRKSEQGWQVTSTRFVKALK